MLRIIKIIKIVFVAVILTLVGLGGYYIYSLFKPADEIKINIDRPAVIKKIKQLNRLETATFLMDKIVDASLPQDNPIKDFFFGDKLILIAHGEVIAGFDLSEISEGDIDIVNDPVMRIRMKLPKAKILITKLDESQTKVYDRQTGILSKGDKDLESKARMVAESSIRNAACDGNILTEAEQGARRYLTALLTSLGFEEVILDIPQSTSKDCKLN